MSDHKTLLVGVVAIALLVTSAYAFVAPQLQTNDGAQVIGSESKKNVVVEPTGELSGVVVSEEEDEKKYTLADVEAHATPDNCWTIVDKKVYDLTPFVSQHPGGVPQILKICGTDGTSIFEAQHGGSERQEKQLESLYIGDLED